MAKLFLILMNRRKSFVEKDNESLAMLSTAALRAKCEHVVHHAVAEHLGELCCMPTAVAYISKTHRAHLGLIGMPLASQVFGHNHSFG